MSAKFKPVNGYVMVKRHEKDDVSEGGIILTATNQPLPSSGVVIHSDINEWKGKVAVWEKHAEKVFQLETETFTLVHENSIIMIEC